VREPTVDGVLLSALRRWVLTGAAGALILGMGGCGEGDASGASSSGASSPQAAVERFLAPFSNLPPRSQGPTASEEIKGYWASTCDQVDPRIRPGLRFYEDDLVDPRVNCGAVVVLLVMYTGDTGQMAPPRTISGNPVSADTAGDRSVVSVAMRYEIDERQTYTAPPPPPEATVNVLVVKRDGSWWVATPQAFNPLHAADGGYNEFELRQLHEELLAAKDTGAIPARGAP
jgi:hypothetical protein